MINGNTSDVRFKALEAIVAAVIVMMAAAVLLSPVSAEDEAPTIDDGEIIYVDSEEEDSNEPFEWNDYAFQVISKEDLTVSFYGYNGSDKVVFVPFSVQYQFETYSVVSIDTAAFMGRDVEAVIIPEGVTEIGDNAFSYCSYLKYVYVPATVTKIGDYAFNGCSALESFEIPTTVKQIGIGMFSYDENLTHVVLPDGIKEIPEDTFMGCTALSEFEIPSSVVVIGSSAFYGTAFTTITIPYNVTTIEMFAFYEVPLKYIEFPNSLTHIEPYAFSDCSNMLNVKFNDGLKSIGEYAFGDCVSLCSITIPDSVSIIGEGAFSGCTSVISVQIGAGMTYSYDMFNTSPIEAFSVSRNCSSYTVKDGVLYSGNMYNLVAYPKAKTDSSFVIPDDVRIINKGAFYASQNLVSVSGKNVIELGEGAFTLCVKLKNIDLPNLQRIGTYAFAWCAGLESFEIPASVTDIGKAPFILTMKMAAFSVADGNKSFAAKDGVLYNKDLDVLIEYPYKQTETFVIPDDVVEIAEGAFIMAPVNEVIIPSSVEFIGAEAFSNSSIKTVTIPSTVLFIGDKAFSNSSLEKVIIAATNPELGSGIFESCKNLKEAVIEDGVTAIGMYEFSSTALTKVILPESVGIIMDGAFDWDLQYVYIPRGAVLYGGAFSGAYFVDAAGNELAIDELPGYAYAANEDGYLVRQGYSIVSFDENGGSEEAPESIIVANGFEVVLPDYTGTKADYQFSGWFCNDTPYSVGQKVKVESDMEFIAMWYKDVISISFDIVGGKADVSPVTVEIGAAYSVDGNVMTIVGENFTKTVTVTGDYSKTAVVVWESQSGYFIEDTTVSAAFPQYKIDVLFDESQGTIAAPNTAFEGQTVTLKVEPKKGYGIKEITEDKGLVVIKDGRFVMPASDVTIKGLFSELYTITIKTAKGGSVTSDYASAIEGTKVTLTISEDDDYNFKSWKVTPSTVKIDGNDQFVMPASDVTITPEFSFAGTKTAETLLGKVMFKTDSDIKEDTKLTLTINKVIKPKQSNIPSGAAVYSIKVTAQTGSKTVDLTDKTATVTIFVDLEDSQKKVYYVSDDGKTVEKMNAKYDASEGALVFTTTHFSDFVITEKNIDPIKNETMMYIIIAAIILIVIIAVILIAWRVKMNKARP